MTESQLRELEAICERATPGPWETAQTPGFGHDDAPYTVVNENEEQIAECWDNTPGNRSTEENVANAALIAAARTVIPEALAHISLLGAREKQATEMCTWLTQENERLRTALAECRRRKNEACDIAAKWLSVVTGDAPIFANGDTKRSAERIAELRKEAES